MMIRGILAAVFAASTACSEMSSDPSPAHEEAVRKVSSATQEAVAATVSTFTWGGFLFAEVKVINEGAQPTTTWTVQLTNYGTFNGALNPGTATYSFDSDVMTVTPGVRDQVLAPNGGFAAFVFGTQNVPTVLSASGTTGPCCPDTCPDGCCSGGKCYTIETAPYCGTGGACCKEDVCPGSSSGSVGSRSFPGCGGSSASGGGC